MNDMSPPPAPLPVREREIHQLVRDGDADGL